MFGEGEHARQGIIGANWKSAFSAPLYISPESFLPLQAEARVAVFSCPTEGSRGNPARTAYRSYPVFCRACSRPRAKSGTNPGTMHSTGAGVLFLTSMVRPSSLAL